MPPLHPTMKRFIISLALIPLAGCSFWATTPPVEEEEQTSSVSETKNVVYRGTLEILGASIYMEGTHRLELEDGRFVLLEAVGLVLDDYVGEEVEVFGTTRATVEGGGIIMRVERVAVIEESSSSSAESSSEASSIAAVPVSSAAATSSPAPVAPPTPKSSVAPPPASSAAPAPVSSAATNDPLAAKTATMAKVNMSAANWTGQYCSTHVEFCIPVHKNWYYASFGATSSSLWHVEVSSETLETLGDGPISVVLLSGAASVPDGTVTVSGEQAVGVRAWTNGRHFEIRAPKALEAAVRYITQELKAAPAPQQ